MRDTDYKEGKIIEILTKMPGTAIVYVRSRRRTREIAGVLAAAGISADFYHAGLLPEEKEERQNAWKSGRTRVIVATNAFGMGIDKPDVRLVIHYDLPPSLEEYYQEAGRAGRDGKPSFAVLLTCRHDKATLSRRLSEAFPEKDVIRRIYELTGNFLDIAVGEGYNKVYEFNISKFCEIFRYHPKIVDPALRILTQAGYISYSDEITTRSRIMILARRDELYDLELPPKAERILQLILRTSTGIFSDYEHIDEAMLSSRLGISQQEIYESLLQLTRMHVLHYIPRQTSPFILYTTSREEPQHLVFPLAVYEERRQRMAARLEAMKQFAFTHDQCRVNIMLRYFGENPTKPCGKCDICRDNNRAQRSRRQQPSSMPHLARTAPLSKPSSTPSPQMPTKSSKCCDISSTKASLQAATTDFTPILTLNHHFNILSAFRITYFNTFLRFHGHPYILFFVIIIKPEAPRMRLPRHC